MLREDVVARHGGPVLRGLLLQTAALAQSRRLAILEALADGRAWPREDIEAWVSDRVASPAYASGHARVGANRFYQDVRALRRAGMDLRFQRRRGDRGYLWPRARLARQIREAFADLNDDMAPVLARLDPDRKISMVADLADFAMDLRRGRGLGGVATAAQGGELHTDSQGRGS